jgi:syntaxin-binding protein 1
LATGLNAEGEKIRDIMNQINPILLDVGRTTGGFTDYEKLRVIILYVISKNGVPEDSLTKLLTHANIDATLKQIVLNMSLLGPNVVVNGV